MGLPYVHTAKGKGCMVIMKTEPLLSIITPSYNKADFVRQTIESVLTQDYTNFEYIVIDGGSSDQTVEILKEYSDRLYWISEPDRGMSDAINKGFRRAKGEILAWINADDYYYPGAFRSVVDYFAQYPEISIMYGELDYLDRAGMITSHWRVVPVWDYNLLLNGFNYIPQPATFMRREVFETVGDIDVNEKRCMDYDYWLRVGKQYRFGYLPRTLGGIRIMEGTISGISPVNNMKDGLIVSRRHGGKRFSARWLSYWLWRLRLHMFLRHAASFSVSLSVNKYGRL